MEIMIYFPYRGAFYSEFYSPQEMVDYIKSILDPYNLIDSKTISINYLLMDSKGEEYKFRDDAIICIMQGIREIDAYLTMKLHWNQKFRWCNVSQNQYKKLLLTNCNKKSFIKKRNEFQLKQFKLLCSHYMTHPELDWASYYTNSDFFIFPGILDSLLRTPLDIFRIEELAKQYTEDKCFDFSFFPNKIIKGFSCTENDFKKNKHYVDFKKQAYLYRNPYFNEW